MPNHEITNCSQTVGPMLLFGKYKREVGWTCNSYSAFRQTTLVLVIIITVSVRVLTGRSSSVPVQRVQQGVHTALLAGVTLSQSARSSVPVRSQAAP